MTSKAELKRRRPTRRRRRRSEPENRAGDAADTQSDEQEEVLGPLGEIGQPCDEFQFSQHEPVHPSSNWKGRQHEKRAATKPASSRRSKRSHRQRREASQYCAKGLRVSGKEAARPKPDKQPDHQLFVGGTAGRSAWLCFVFVMHMDSLSRDCGPVRCICLD